MFLKGEFSNRLLQVSLFAGIVYYITAYPVVFEKARKYFPIKFKKTHHLLIFHTFVFMVLMYVLTYFVFDPIVKVVEGADQSVTQDPPMTHGSAIITTSKEGMDGWECNGTISINQTNNSVADCLFEDDGGAMGDLKLNIRRSCVDEDNKPGKFVRVDGKVKCMPNN